MKTTRRPADSPRAELEANGWIACVALGYKAMFGGELKIYAQDVYSAKSHHILKTRGAATRLARKRAANSGCRCFIRKYLDTDNLGWIEV